MFLYFSLHALFLSIIRSFQSHHHHIFTHHPLVSPYDCSSFPSSFPFINSLILVLLRYETSLSSDPNDHSEHFDPTDLIQGLRDVLGVVCPVKDALDGLLAQPALKVTDLYPQTLLDDGPIPSTQVFKKCISMTPIYSCPDLVIGSLPNLALLCNLHGTLISHTLPLGSTREDYSTAGFRLRPRIPSLRRLPYLLRIYP